MQILSNVKGWPKELVYIDLDRAKFEFFTVELIKGGYNHFQTIFHYGKYGNKGTTRIYRFSEENSYLDARNTANNKVKELKAEGYVIKNKMEEVIRTAIKESLKTSNNSNKKRFNSQPYNKSENHSYFCDLCNRPIHYSLYRKIENWGRNEGNWDYDKASPFYKKIVCLDCQIDKGIFQKRIDETFQLN